MQYVDVTVSECELAFSRIVKPAPENNQLTRYSRFVDISTLDLNLPLSVEFVTLPQVRFYNLKIPFTQAYMEGPLEVFRKAKIQIRNELGTNSWPLPGPGFYSEIVEPGERLLRQYLPDLQRYNRWVDETEFGEVTRLSEMFQLAHPQEEFLETFLQRLRTYSTANNCGG